VHAQYRFLSAPRFVKAALLLRQTRGRKDELVALITSAEPLQLDALSRLCLDRDSWGIESSLHQRLDVSHNFSAIRG
jgi:hypothetical protein